MFSCTGGNPKVDFFLKNKLSITFIYRGDGGQL